MTKKEFINEAVRRGYANKKDVTRWCEKTGREDFMEEDFIEVFRFGEKMDAMSLDGMGYVAGHPRTTKSYKTFNSHETGGSY